MSTNPRHKSKPKNGMKVVILNDSSVAKGGATGLALLSAKLLRQRGIDTTFIAGDSGDKGALAAHSVTLQALGGKLLLDNNAAKTMTQGLYNTGMREKISAYIRKNDTPHTIYHLHGWSRILSPAVFDALRPVASRTHIHAHDFFLACPNGAYYNFRKAEVCTRKPLSGGCIATACDRRSYHHKLWRVARGTVLRRTFNQDLPWGSVLNLHTKMAEPLARAGIPADLIKTVTNPAKPFTRDRIKAEDNDAFCFVGRVEEGKGVRTLCAAARLAEVPLHVIGDGALLNELRVTHPEVTFTGWVDQSNIGAHLTGTKALVMPSQTPEPFGLVAAEASLSGLPVIASKQALLANDLADLGLGFAADTATPEPLALALKKLASLPKAEIQTMSMRGFDGTNSVALTPDDWTDSLISHYNKALP